MTVSFIEIGNLDGLFRVILMIMFGPAVLLAIIGFIIRRRYKKAAKVLFILATVYVTVSLGICGVLVST